MLFDNPFANFGSIVEGDRFIGRKNELREIESRITRSSESGNLAIIGLPRIGKSSLANKALIERKKELIEKKIVPVWINLSIFENSKDFLISLVEECMYELAESNLTNSSIYNAYQNFKENISDYRTIHESIRRFFQRIRRENYRIIFVIDEFDHAKNIFKENIVSFQRLRDLADNPNWRVTFLIISRRTIRDIEVQSAGISTFDGIFHKIFLSMFDESDMDEYFRRIEVSGLKLKDSEKDKIIFYCGRYPYLLSALAYSLIENYYNNQLPIDLDTTANRILATMIEHYERLIDLLKEDGSLYKLLQLLYGPIYDVNKSDVDQLRRTGLIFENENGYTTFSNHFQIFLNIIYREIDLWPLYRETEKVLRKIISEKMTEFYGNEWIDILLQRHPKLNDSMKKAYENLEKERKYYGGRASNNLLDYTYIMDLFAIIFREWNIFSTIFGKDKNYWDERAKVLSKVRNVLAHCREESLYEDTKIIAEGYCKEIIRIIRESSL